MTNQAQPASAGGLPSIQQRLRNATERAHRETERVMDLPRSITVTADYVVLLRTLWSFHAALEARLDSVRALTTALPDWPERRKACLLAADLARMGAELPAPDARTVAALASINGVAAAFGALYVVEGATLGGAVVGPQIRAKLDDGHLAFAFYGCYGGALAARWRAFLAGLARQAESSRQARDRIEAAAILTFETFLEHVGRAP